MRLRSVAYIFYQLFALYLRPLYALLYSTGRATPPMHPPLLKADIALSYSQLGILLSSFFWTSPVFQFVSCCLFDLFPVIWVLSLLILLWSAATFGTALLSGFP